MAVVVGANGSGKSTLFDALTFLRESLSEISLRPWHAEAASVNW